ncbi:hypothetical protein SNEBB_005121 [Seison nebaliae]|nr:hypothetical protein SNEBB_005121 [Seison nebaliae]
MMNEQSMRDSFKLVELQFTEDNLNDLKQLCELINVAREPKRETQKQVQQLLNDLSRRSEFLKYLSVIVIDDGRNFNDEIKILATILLKNHSTTMVIDQTELLKRISLLIIDSDSLSNQIKRIISGLIINILLKNRWDDLINYLSRSIQLMDEKKLIGIIDCIEQLFELFRTTGNNNEQATLQLISLIPIITNQITNTSLPIRQRTKLLRAFVVVLENEKSLMIKYEKEFIEILFHCANEDDLEMRGVCCKICQLILYQNPLRMENRLGDVVEYVLVCMEKKNEQLAFEACEFFLILLNMDMAYELLEKHQERFSNLLMNYMKYGGEELTLLELEYRNDSTIPDEDKDILPPTYSRDKFHDSNNSTIEEENAEERNDDDDDDENDEEETSHITPNWNLRKCSATVLDSLSNIFQDNFLQFILPKLNDMLHHSNWIEREAGILILGAIAYGCVGSISQHLPNIIPHLIMCLDDDQPLIRSISCWTLSRYLEWIKCEDSSSYFYPMLDGIERRMLDNSKKVQEGACSTLADMEESAIILIMPRLDGLINLICQAFNIYQKKNIIRLYDVIASLIDSARPLLRQDIFTDLITPNLMEYMMKNWAELDNNYLAIFPIYQCMSTIAISMSGDFRPYVNTVLTTAVKLTEKTFKEYFIYKNNENKVTDPTLSKLIQIPEMNYISISFDLFNALTNALQLEMSESFEKIQIIQIIRTALNLDLGSNHINILQSSLALIGEIIDKLPNLMVNDIQSFLPLILLHIKSSSINLINNSIWCLGKAVLRYDIDVSTYIDDIEPVIMRHLLNEKNIRLIQENVAITFGIITHRNNLPFSNYFEKIFPFWCHTLSTLDDNENKDVAFRGMCKLISFNTDAARPHFHQFLLAASSWINIKDDLAKQFVEILQYYMTNGMETTVWEEHLSNLNESARNRIQTLLQNNTER